MPHLSHGNANGGNHRRLKRPKRLKKIGRLSRLGKWEERGLPLATFFEVEYDLRVSSYTAIYKQDGDYWIGWIEEVPGVNAQEKTKEELLASLKVILREALEFNRAEARQAAEANYTEEPIVV